MNIARTESYEHILTSNQAAPDSAFRTVFGEEALRDEFVNFLKTIFFQLDEKKVLEEMDLILSDPMKTDQQIYEELVISIDRMRKQFPSLFYQLKSLSVLQKGMGRQVAEHLSQDFRQDEFQNYMEIYFRRYFKTIHKVANLPLKGKVFAVCDAPPKGNLKEKIEAGALLSSYPYEIHIPLNDLDCTDPEILPEKTHKPLGNEVVDKEIDLMVCLGGLHHIPEERVGPFVDGLQAKMKPGAVLLLRDHDVDNPKIHAIASVVHSFVNASSGVSWEVEKKEVRNFQSAEYWINLLKDHGFVRINSKNLVLKNDPTLNGMMAFFKVPQNLDELKIAVQYRKSCVRAADGSSATGMEWGNVRFSKQYAEFIQTRHSYAFDFIGHIKQHWKYLSYYLKERKKHSSKKVTSGDLAMNLFIFISTLFQCTSSYLRSLPSQGIARITQGSNWRNATDLTNLEKYEAQIEKEYSEFIDHTPFYLFPYVSKIKGLWSTVNYSKENFFTKAKSYINACSTTISLLFKTAISIPIRFINIKEGKYIAPDRVSILIHDPTNQFETGIKCIGGQHHSIVIVSQLKDGHKVVLVPRYRPFTKLCQELSENNNVKLLEIGCNSSVLVDVLYKKEEETLQIENAELQYEMEKLQNFEKLRYATYRVNVAALAEFQRKIGLNRIEYIHE